MLDLQLIQDVNPHTTHTQTKAKSASIIKTHSHRDNIAPTVTMFKWTKQIIMDMDTLSHSTTLHNKILQSLNLSGLYKYDNSCQAYLFEYSNNPVNCSYILVFLRQSACYTITPDTSQWYRINTNEITDNYNLAMCNATTIKMVLIPTAEPSKSNAFETIMRLTCSQNQRDPPNDNQTQAISNISMLTINTICNTSQNNKTQSYDQFTMILQQFSMITNELKDFTNKVSSAITKIMQAYTTSQGNSCTLTAVFNLTGYLMTAPILTKRQQQY